MPRWSLSNEERFMKSVVKSENGCWIWNGCSKECGSGIIYGSFYMNKKSWYTHRASWVLHKGEIAKGMQINHKCDIPLCVNPEHLYVGTHQDNMRDMKERNRRKGKGGRFGEANSNSKLTTEIADAIRVLYSTGEYTQQELADYLGVYQGTISQVILNKRFS